MEDLKAELRDQKNMVKQQKKEIEKLKIQNEGLLERLRRYETKPKSIDSDSDIEILEIEPEKFFSKQEISKFRQLNLRSGVKLEKIPVFDLDNFVATVIEKSNQTRVKLPRPPKLRKAKKRMKRSSSIVMVESDIDDTDNDDDDLDYYTTERYSELLSFRENSGSSENLRKLINAGRHLKSKIKAGANLPDGVELV